jgi:hypothetical protein
MNAAHAFRCCSALLVLSVAGASSRAVELTPNSPFAPPSNNADTSATTANAPLELHGILATPDGYEFNLCDQAGNVNVWIGLNATGQPFVVRSHDVAHNRVTVEYQGRELTLSLAQPEITSTPMSMPQVGGMPPYNPKDERTQAEQMQDERMRLERIAEEIRRRRALRAAAQQQQQFPPGGTHAPAQPQPRN